MKDRYLLTNFEIWENGLKRNNAVLDSRNLYVKL